MTWLRRLRPPVLLGLAYAAVVASVCGAEDPPVNVLVVHSYHVGMPWADEVTRGLMDGLNGHAELVITQLDIKRHPPTGREAGIVAVTTAKAAMSQPRVIIAIDDFAYQLLLERRAEIAPGVPIVFGGVNYWEGPQPAGVTGVVESLDLAGTLDLMVRLQPQAKRWVIVNDLSETGVANRRALDPVLERHPGKQVRWLGEGTFAETEAQLRDLHPRDDAVLLLSWNLDAAGATQSYELAAQRARLQCPAPIHGVWSFYFGHGIVGGSLLDARTHGEEVGALVKRILNGTSPDDIPVVTHCRTRIQLDHRELTRFAMEPAHLPPGSEIAYVPETLWTQYRRLILGAAVIIALQSITISWLLVIRRHRNRALKDLRRNEADLRLTQERVGLALEGADLGIWDWDIPQGSLSVDTRWAGMLGYRPDEIRPTREGWESLIHPEDLPAMQAAISQHLQGKSAAFEVEFRMRHKRGSWVWVLSKGKVTARDANGSALRASGTHLDTTERRKHEAALRSTERKLAEIFRSSPEIIALTRVDDGRFIEVNDAFTRVFDYTHAEVVGHTSTELGIWPAPEDRTRLLSQILEHGRLRNHELQFRRKDGALVPFLISVTDITIEEERCLIWLLTDITERRHAEQEHARLQSQLQQAVKMEAVGRLAGGVAHDFNNLLTVISGNVELVRDEIAPDTALASHLAEVARAASSAATLTRQLLAFSRRELLEPRAVDLNELIDHLRKMLVRLIGEDVQLETSLASDLGTVRVDPGQFDQVVINLAVNARDAMPRGGRLTIATANAELDEAYCAKHPSVTPGRFVMLSVSDNGEGMPPEVQQRIFEPFFTTKPMGRGTGLGLAMIFGIVKQSGGAIEVYSELAHGTTFKIYLPRVDAPRERLARDPIPRELPRGSETILVVEDDPSVRALAHSMLRRLGYTVLVASNGTEALHAAGPGTDRIDLVLTDLVMPGMSGREVAEHILKLHPDAAVLYTSGYTEDAIVRHGVMTDQLAFIGKPYSLPSLARKVRDVLDARTEATRP